MMTSIPSINENCPSGNNVAKADKHANTRRKPTLERIFEQILAYCKEQDHNGEPPEPDEEEKYTSNMKNNLEVPGGTGGECRSTNTTSSSNCRTACCATSYSYRMPAFSLSFNDATATPACLCHSNSCCVTQSRVQNPQIDCSNTSGNSNRVLQIHLPESSQEPCRIMISSNQDQITVKYLKQGQQFTFLASSSDNNITENTSACEDFDKFAAKTRSNSRNDEVPGKRGIGFSADNMQYDTSDDNTGALLSRKRQRDESPAESNFYDLFLQRRMEEEQRKSSEVIDDDDDECSGSENDQDGTSDGTEVNEVDFKNQDPVSLPHKTDVQQNTKESFMGNYFCRQEVSEIKSGETNSIDIASHENSVPKSNTDFLNPRNTSRGRFKCQYCTESFEQRIEYIAHQNTHANDRPYNCPLCNESFKQRRSLKYHIKHHNGERPYKCMYCEKAFKEKYHLTVHIRTHTGERPFSCTICGKAFKQTNELTSHIRTHTGEKPYSCTLCDKWFKRRSQLYHHNQTSHIESHGLFLGLSDRQSNTSSNLESTPTTISSQ